MAEFEAEFIRLAERVRRSESPEHWLGAAREMVAEQAAFMAIYDDAMNGLSAKERQVLATDLRRKLGKMYGPTAIKRLKVKLSNPDEYIRALAFDICVSVNAAT